MSVPTKLMAELVERGGSDLHCKVGSPPTFRVGGELQRADAPSLVAEAVARMAQAFLDEGQRQTLLREGSVLTAHSEPGVGRFRVAVFRQRGTASIVIHAVADDIRPLGELGLPTAATTLAEAERGLVLVGSPVGNGSTTTLASLVDHVNRHRSTHIVTVDDPIEYLHRDERSMISQLEVGVDVGSLRDGVRAAARLDADVVTISDVRSHDVALAALDGVARGQLVFGVLGGDTVQSVLAGFLELFSAEERDVVRRGFGRSLAGVVVQRLVPAVDGTVRVAAEAVVNTPKVVQAISDESRLGELRGLMEEGQFSGMQTLDQALERMVRSGEVAEDVALGLAVDPEELRITLLQS